MICNPCKRAADEHRPELHCTIENCTCQHRHDVEHVTAPTGDA